MLNPHFFFYLRLKHVIHSTKEASTNLKKGFFLTGGRSGPNNRDSSIKSSSSVCRKGNQSINLEWKLILINKNGDNILLNSRLYGKEDNKAEDGIDE